jgi:MFS transporter, Spinster family, sphingosine-1-phosphate transporter
MPSSSSAITRTAWLTVALLFPVALLNYLDRQLVATMKLSMMRDVVMSGDDQWGYMLGQFKWVYALFSPVGGYIADRFSRRLVICGSLFVWSLVTYLTGQVHSYDELLWARAAMGVSEAFYIPAALALIADFHSGATRSRAIGLHQMGIYCGVMVGAFAGYAADSPAIGWRGAFDYAGLVGILYALPLLFLLKDAPNTALTIEPKPKVGRALHELLTNPAFLLLVVYFTLPAIAGWVVRDWMPAILQKSFNISQGKAGVSASLYWQAAAIVSAFVGGYWADRWMQSNERGRIYVSAIGMALIVPALFGVGNAPALNSFSLAMASLVLFGIGWGFFDGNNMPILSQIVRPELRATGYGIMNMVSISLGGLADWAFGVLTVAQVPMNQIFGIFASLCVISLLIVLRIQPRTRH